MIRSPSASTWERVLSQALAGDAQPLRHLLLVPVRTDNRNEPLPDEDGMAFYPLPEDRGLRERIVRVLMLLGQSKRKPGRPKVEDREIVMAELWMRSGGSLDEAAAAVGLEPETLRKRVAQRRKPAPSRQKPPR